MPQLQGVSSDAGRTDSLIPEKNDCTVRAYATVTGMSYRDAWRELAAAGRKFRKGFHVEPFYRKKFGFPLPRPNCTVHNFVNAFCKHGKWIVLVRGHVFAVVDGVVHDMRPEMNANKHVLMVWRVH